VLLESILAEHANVLHQYLSRMPDAVLETLVGPGDYKNDVAAFYKHAAAPLVHVVIQLYAERGLLRLLSGFPDLMRGIDLAALDVDTASLLLDSRFEINTQKLASRLIKGDFTFCGAFKIYFLIFHHACWAI
jgi:hypothetical protein